MNMLSAAELQNQSRAASAPKARARFHPNLKLRTPSQQFGLAMVSDQPKAGQQPVQARATRPEDAEQDTWLHHAFDIANPLHHIPGIGTLYRETQGDSISPLAAAAGGFAFFGPLGAAASFAIAAFEAAGQDDAPADSSSPTTPHSTPQNLVQASGNQMGQSQADQIFTRTPPPTDLASEINTVMPEARSAQEATASFDRMSGAISNGAILGSLTQLSRGDATRHLANHRADPLAALGGSRSEEADQDTDETGETSSARNQAPNGSTAKNQSLSQVGLAAQMIAALDKYEALKREQMSGSASPVTMSSPSAKRAAFAYGNSG